MRIFHLPNNKAYSLLDTLISLFIVSFTLVSVLLLLRGNIKMSKNISDKIESVSEKQNEKSEAVFEKCE